MCCIEARHRRENMQVSSLRVSYTSAYVVRSHYCSPEHSKQLLQADPFYFPTHTNERFPHLCNIMARGQQLEVRQFDRALRIWRFILSISFQIRIQQVTWDSITRKIVILVDFQYTIPILPPPTSYHFRRYP